MLQYNWNSHTESRALEWWMIPNDDGSINWSQGTDWWNAYRDCEMRMVVPSHHFWVARVDLRPVKMFCFPLKNYISSLHPMSAVYWEISRTMPLCQFNKYSKWFLLNLPSIFPSQPNPPTMPQSSRSVFLSPAIFVLSGSSTVRNSSLKTQFPQI